MSLTTQRPQRHKKTGGRLAALTAEDGRFVFAVPDDVPAFLLAANDAVLNGRLDEAVTLLNVDACQSIEDLLQADPQRSDILFILAKLCWDTHQWERAEFWFRRILAIEAHADVYDQLARLLFEQRKQRCEAAEFSCRAHELRPGDISFHQNYARSLVRSGRLEEGIAEFRRARELFPAHSGVWFNALWFSHYASDVSGAEINAGYRHWHQLQSPMTPRSHHTNDRDPERPLRIGYLSPNFRHHAVNYMFEQILDGHDRNQVAIVGYGHVSHPDHVTARLQGKCDGYRDLWGQSAETIADWIVADRIDILVEIGGHVIDNRLDVLRLKPAPLQMDMGGLSTTGLPQVDYRITDAAYDPPELADSYDETCLYLPGGLSCFRVPEVALPVNALPAQSNGHITFGSFNAQAKISAQVFDLWTQILTALPEARLVLKFEGAEADDMRDVYLARFEEAGIARQRVDMIGWLDWEAHWHLFHQVDLLLDTYPYNGGTTTLEGLWMGVPTVSLTGSKFVARAGWSILQRLGLAIFVAEQPAEYVDKALAFARQPQALAQIRAGLRTRMQGSPLCTAGRMAQELETLYRQCWQRWCVGQGGGA